MTRAEKDRVLRCEGCGREVERCAFCEGDDCRECICFRCLIYEIGQTHSYLTGRPAPKKA